MLENLLVGREIQWQTLGIVLAIFLGLALVFTIIILIVSKVCHIDEDKKIAQILERLGGSNCGGCGNSGCAAFAHKLAEGKGNVSDCHSCSAKNRKEIAMILGQDTKEEEPTMAIVHCNGGLNAENKFTFVGNRECTSLNMFQGGDKICRFGCLGGGTCESVCPYGAISVNENHVAVVDKQLCTSCGACINHCPKLIIGRVPVSAPVYIACSSQCKGREVITGCKNGCITCGKCVKACPENAITMVDNLPVIDYSKCTGCKACVSVCPRNVIKELL